MKNSALIREEITDMRAEVQAMIDLAETEKRELLDDEQARVDEILNVGGLLTKAEANLERVQKIEANKHEAIRAGLASKLDANLIENGLAPLKAPARARTTALSSFKDADEAYLSGQYIMAHVLGNRHSQQWCADHGIKAVMTTGNNPKGGYLVPEPLEATIIELREVYGVARGNCRVVPMTDGNNTWPKINSEVTAYYVGENAAITASDVGLEQVRLEAKKLATLTAVSSELNEDSVIAVAEMLSRSIASQFAKAEDSALFLGDGTSTYGGILGVVTGGALAAGSIHTALSGNTAFGTLDLVDFEAAVSKLPQYAAPGAKWFISRAGYWLSMARLADAAGGNTNMNLAGGPGELQFLGIPVVFSQVLPVAAAATVDTHLCYVGDFDMGALLGDRRGISVVADESFYFSQDSLAIRATERYDINVHDRGTSTVGGAIIALDTPGS